MKRILFSFFALSAAALSTVASVHGQSALFATPSAPATLKLEAAPTPDATPRISFEKTTYEFGEIPQGVPATCRFEFTNTGKADLVITGAKPGCGCTKPTYTETPIKPGEKGYVDATYNAVAGGSFYKNVTIESNAGTPVLLYLKGDVKIAAAPEPAPEPESAPAAVPSLAPALSPGGSN